MTGAVVESAAKAAVVLTRAQRLGKAAAKAASTVTLTAERKMGELLQETERQKPGQYQQGQAPETRNGNTGGPLPHQPPPQRPQQPTRPPVQQPQQPRKPIQQPFLEPAERP